MQDILTWINTIIWGIPVLILILGVGIWLSLRTGGAQIRLIPLALRNFFKSFKIEDSKGITGYKALCTALAATVGTGNIAGVAGAICLGGPGVIFWMWMSALLGMGIKLAEVTLAVHYRTTDAQGRFLGGPMYMISKGLPMKYHFLSYIYCFFGIIAAFGIGNATQVNAVIGGVKNIASAAHYELKPMQIVLIGVITAGLVYTAFSKGAEGIGNWAQRLIPFASGAYIFMSIGVLIACRSKLIESFVAIISGAFSPKAVTGGIIGSLFLTLRVGVSRGIFTNEAGMGTASIAHAASEVNHPVLQGLLGIVEVFLDTIVICTLTALVVLCSNVSIPFGTDPGINLTMDAFSCVYGNWCNILIAILTGIFAFATILGWGLYGARCAQYLFGEKAWRFFAAAQAVCILVSVVLETSVVWVFSELVNGLMAIPNLFALILLSPVFFKILKDYMTKKEAYSLR